MRVLLIDQDIDSMDVTAYALRREGFYVATATSGTTGLSRLRSERPHIVLVSSRLPDMTGLDVCERIRQEASLPIILLSETMDDEHVVLAFRSGVDDVVGKPFSPRQLTMRIRAVWRRSEMPGDPEPQRIVRVGGLSLDVDAYEVRRDDLIAHLTPTEFRLLYILALNARRVVTSARLLAYGWGYDQTDALLLKTHICRIRQKLRLPRGAPGDIVSLPGVGYRLTAEEVDAPAREDAPRRARPGTRREDAGTALAPLVPMPPLTPIHAASFEQLAA